MNVPAPLQSFLLVARHRWWIAPLVLTVSTSLIWAQESELRTSPAKRSVTTSIEVTDNLNALLAVGIQPQAVVKRPSELGQLRILGGSTTRKRLTQKVGGDARVGVSQAASQVQFISAITDSDGKDSFTFRFVPNNVFTLSCDEEMLTFCEPMIEAYTKELVDLRRQSIVAGLEDLSSILTGSLSKATQPNLISQLQMQLASLSALKLSLEVDANVLSTETEVQGATVTSVSRSSYGFGMLIAGVVVLIIWAQLALNDKRIHTQYQLEQRLSDFPVLGTVGRDATMTKYAAAMISSAVQTNNLGFVRLIPVSTTIDSKSTEKLQSQLKRVGSTLLNPLPSLEVEEIIGSTGDGDVLLVKRHIDTFDTIKLAVSLLSESGRPLLGVLLVS